jgi:hypothetical protein
MMLQAVSWLPTTSRHSVASMTSSSRWGSSNSTRSTLAAIFLLLLTGGPGRAQEPPPAQWLRLDPLPAEIGLTPRESFDGVPPRFVLLTDGSVFVGGRRDVLRGWLDKKEMQAISTRLDLAIKSLGKARLPQTLVVGDGPPIFRFSVLLGSPFEIVVSGNLESSDGPPLAPLPDFVRGLAGFRHPSLKPWDPDRFTLIVKEKTLPGGCRLAPGLTPLAPRVGRDQAVASSFARGFPTGSDMAQVCEGPKRYTVVFRPLIPGER